MSGSLIFVDCEADFHSPCPGIAGGMTEFGAVEFATRKTFHGIKAQESWHSVFVEFDKWLAQFSRPLTFVSDNPAYDWQWINYHFWHELGKNPFGHSARRISDFYAGLRGDFYKTQQWKRFRKTKHDHNPIHDALGNVEAFAMLLQGKL